MVVIVIDGVGIVSIEVCKIFGKEVCFFDFVLCIVVCIKMLLYFLCIMKFGIKVVFSLIMLFVIEDGEDEV